MLLNNHIDSKDKSLDSIKRALINLENSEMEYNELYCSMKEAAAVNEMCFNDQGMPENYKVIDVNPAYSSLFGMDKDLLLNKPTEELFNFKSSFYLDHYSKAFKTSDVYTFNAFFPPLSKYFKISVFKINNNRFVSVFRDVTVSIIEEEIVYSNSEYLCKLNAELEKAKSEIKVALQEAEMSNAKFNSLLSATEGQIYICNKDYSIEYTNVSYLSNLLNIPNSDKCYKLIHGIDEPCSWCPLQKAYKEKKLVTLEYERGNAVYRVVASSLSKSDSDSVMLMVTDITNDRKLTKEVIESYQNLKAIYDGSLDGITMINKKGQIVFWNNAAEKELHYKENEILGKNILDIIPERYHKSFKEEFKEFKHTSKTSFYGYPVVISALKKDGQEVQIELSLSFLKNKGEILLLAIFRSNYNRYSLQKEYDEEISGIKSLYEKALVPVRGCVIFRI